VKTSRTRFFVAARPKTILSYGDEARKTLRKNTPQRAAQVFYTQ
jgi:hypothetical protein